MEQQISDKTTIFLNARIYAPDEQSEGFWYLNVLI